ncbi:MAG: valine--tRNA ligase, partial [Opitutae bacterium]|nr:valine--tRNA ligase [Opitutae bacterium]
MSNEPEIPKAYDPSEVEDRWYSHWEEDGCFAGKPSAGQPSYSIVIPPPNVTGVLTMGHVLNNTIQDILSRRARQKGASVMWLPGTDHAGIATQTKVEKSLREEGLSRRDLGREKFLERAVEWRDKHGGIILRQLRKLGCSCDWERNVHTLDDDYSRAVLSGFVKLFERGYVYRGKRMVNWCPASLTALSDEEVIMKPQDSTLYKIRYQIMETPDVYLEVSTTRPETIMGDVAVAIHPDDERWSSLKGKHVIRPLQEAPIPIIADDAVEKEFGTGMLKITPAHDQLDFEIGQRHDLPIIDVLNPDGTLNEHAGPDFAGMDRFAARKATVERLRENGSLVDEESHSNNVGFSERADVPIEPRLSEQWFLKYPRVEEAKRAVKEGFIRYFPERWEKTYLHWLENIKDWCISRQLWWGHRIPVWHKRVHLTEDNWSNELLPWGWDSYIEGNWKDEHDTTVVKIFRVSDGCEVDVNEDSLMPIVKEAEGDYDIFYCSTLPEDGENLEQYGFKQDEDVLDTWASSWLWPFATMGWPDEQAMAEQDLASFYPTSALVTGPDIIFFWVARMVMAGLEFMGEPVDKEETLSDEEIKRRIPFRDVYFTGIIRDSRGRKMSKSLGNSPDPLDLIDKFGADGLRHGIMSIAPKGQDIRFSEESIEQGRNFCNKLWNVSRFRRMSGEARENSSLDAILSRLEPEKLDAEDHAILARLAETLDQVERDHQAYEFNSVLHGIYRFFWHDFCDWYVEVSKAKLRDDSVRETCLAVQDLCLRQTLLLLHPVTPFITEELWQRLGYSKEGSSIQYVGPGDGAILRQALSEKGISIDEEAEAEIGALREVVTALRALKAERGLATNREVALHYLAEDDKSETLQRHMEKLLLFVGAASFERIAQAPSGQPSVVTPLGTAFLDLASGIDLDAERARLDKEIANLEKVVASTEARLSNESFTAKAPPEVIEGARRQLTETQTKLTENRAALQALG